MRDTNHLDLIIPVYKNAALTKACVNSILSNLDEIKHLSPRLILINDSPDHDEVSELLLALAAKNETIAVII